MAPQVRSGHTLMTELVAAGEIPIVLTLYNQAVDKLKEKGGPIDWKPLAPAFGRADGIALARQAQHPHAALLFADFVLSPEGQRLIKERARVPVNRKVDSTFDQSAFGIIDLAALLKEWDTWEGRWQALFLRGRKGKSGSAAIAKASFSLPAVPRRPSASSSCTSATAWCSTRSIWRSALRATAMWRSRLTCFPGGTGITRRCAAGRRASRCRMTRSPQSSTAVSTL